MNTIWNKATRALLVALPLSVMAGCAGAGMGTLGDILASAGGVSGPSELSGEIRAIDTRRQEIQIASGGFSGSRWVNYDGRTEVVYGQRRYDVRDLEYGDQVWMRIENDRSGVPYASYIQIQQTALDRQDRGNTNARVERIDGTVRSIDTRRGIFELEQNRGVVMMVTLPNQSTRTVTDRFQRLRRGDRVRIEGLWVSQNTVELRRFL